MLHLKALALLSALIAASAPASTTKQSSPGWLEQEMSDIYQYLSKFPEHCALLDISDPSKKAPDIVFRACGDKKNGLTVWWTQTMQRGGQKIDCPASYSIFKPDSEAPHFTCPGEPPVKSNSDAALRVMQGTLSSLARRALVNGTK